MFLDKYIQENGFSSDYPVFENNIYKDLFIKTNDLFLAQYKNNKFNAVDIAVKYLAIENYYGLNNYGFELYNRLQYYRINQNWEKRFIKLIESFEDGYDQKSIIDTDLNYSIHDGAHRTALALYKDIPEVKIRLFNTFLYRREYGIDWLKKYFKESELTTIEKKLDELLNKARKPYICILWPPAYQLFELIENEITNIEAGISIPKREKMNLYNDSLKQFIYDVYKTDDIRLEKLNLKYQYMVNSMNKNPYLKEPYPIDIMNIKINNPDFRVKPLTGLPQSKTTMRLKTYIRDKYQKYVLDYHYDIMMHITDNTKQNDDVKKIIKKTKYYGG